MAMPNFHLGGSWVCLSALYYGGAISIIPAFEPTLFIEALRRDRPTILPLVPTAIQLMVTKFDLRESDCDCVRSILYFGSPIGRELMNTALKKLRCEFSQLYGTTEAYFLTILNHQQHITGSDQRLSSCGAALPLVSMKVVGSDDKEVPNGTIGEIAVRTPMMFNGYYRQPELTKDVLRGGWYHTGDLGWRDDEGFHHIVDRAKDMIISGGENVYSAEVEAALLKHPSVVSLAVIGVPDPQWGEKVIALVVLAPKLQVSEAELKEHCRKYVAGYKVPKEIRFETALPLTPTGKVQKAVLRKRFREQS
jgi:long-chain acyl-CoA synthetase